MKSFVFLLLIATITCISVVHSAPVSLTRNNHRVDEPLGFLTNFILNKRARVVQTTAVVPEGKKRAVDSRASTSPRYTNTYWKSIKPKTLAHSVKTDSGDAGKSKPVIDLLLFGDLTDRNQRTAEVTAAEVTPEDIPPSSDVAVMAPVVEIVEITPEEISPAEVTVETPVVELVEIVQVAEAVAATENVAVATAEASAAATDGSATASAATSSAVSETVEKGSPAKPIEVPVTHSKKVVYVDKTADFRVTLEVIKVEFDPVYHHESTFETVSESSAAVEKAPVAVEASAGASASSTDDPASASAAVAEAAAVIPVDLVILIETDGVSSAAEVAPAAVASASAVGAIPGVDSAPATVIVATPVVSTSATAAEASETAAEASETAVEASETAVEGSGIAVEASAIAVEASATAVEAPSTAVAAPVTAVAIPVVEVPVPSKVESAATYVRPGITHEAPAVEASDAATKTDGGVERKKGSASSGGKAEGKGKGGKYWETGGDSDSEED